MSYLDHRCHNCGHQKLWHRERHCSYGYCKCTLSLGAFGPPEVFVTTVPASGEVVERITPPGEPLFYPTDHSCDCPQCHAAFGEAVDVEW